MRSKAAFLDHPVHPMLVPLAIGLFVWTLVADVVFLVTDDRMWYDIAFWSANAGIASALLAALPGFVDYFAIAVNSSARGMATVHMFLNLAAVALFVAAAIVMRDGNAVEGGDFTAVIILHALANTGLAISGWLGGEMVYRHHLGVIPPESTLGSRAEALDEPTGRRAA